MTRLGRNHPLWENPVGISNRNLWQVQSPNGQVIFRGVETRYEALTKAFDPTLPMTSDTFHKLEQQNLTVAGWAPITADGWRIERQGTKENA